MLDRVLEGLGYELVELEQARPGGLMRVFIDHPDGIRLEDCELVSNHLTRLFAVENVDYSRLEVSSPGLDRVLRKDADFERFAGHQVSVKLRVPRDGQRKFIGTLKGLAGRSMAIEVDGRPMELPLDAVAKVRLVPEVDTRGRATGKVSGRKGRSGPSAGGDEVR